MTMIDDKPFDYLNGKKEGDKQIVIDKVTNNSLINNLLSFVFNRVPKSIEHRSSTKNLSKCMCMNLIKD